MFNKLHQNGRIILHLQAQNLSFHIQMLKIQIKSQIKIQIQTQVKKKRIKN